ncbi:MAG: ferric reductase-like transmembrane domain-containing protein [Pseudomonadota bacterium]
MLTRLMQGRGAWLVLAVAILLPLVLAGFSPLLAWRDPIYIVAGFAGIITLPLLLAQPLLAAGLMPGLGLRAARFAHMLVGVGLLLAVVIHVAGLWVTSPPDVVDVLLLRSPTPFAIWGVIAMWAVFISAGLALFRMRLQLRWRSWRTMHSILAVLIVVGTVVHALLIEGTMEVVSKWALCVLVVLAALRVLGEPATLSKLVKPGR